MSRTSYAGVEVITSQDAPVRHPRWGRDRPVRLAGATLLLLSDGTPVVVCNECEYNGITGYEPYAKPAGEPRSIMDQADSMLAHVNGKHHPNKANRRTSFYDDERLRTAIKIWMKWKHTNIRNWTQKACEDLDQMGVKPFRGESWTTGQLGSLVREQIRKSKFKNLKAAPLTEEDQAYLATLVREAAQVAAGPTSVASNVRITEKKPHQHKPVDFDKIIEDQEAAKKQQEEVVVPAGEPVLTFASLDSEPESVLVVEVPKPSPRKANPIVTVPPIEIIGGDFKHVVDLPDGSPLFTYKGKLMVGRPVKDVQT